MTKILKNISIRGFLLNSLIQYRKSHKFDSKENWERDRVNFFQENAWDGYITFLSMHKDLHKDKKAKKASQLKKKKSRGCYQIPDDCSNPIFHLSLMYLKAIQFEKNWN